MSLPGPRTQFKLVPVDDLEQSRDQDFLGRVIAGRYTIRAHIGGGGMADVYRASDEQLGVDVAVKLLRPGMASDDLRARMIQEARAAARVRHPNLVRVFGTGKLDATAYIVMELLDGPNLESYLRARPDQRLAWRDALDLLLPALAALHAVHERGHVHRDIKASNILVTAGAPPTAVVIDLGLVKPAPALRDAASPPTTEVGRLLCTPGYTSPEQAAGLPVDRRSDVYSMAITLYRVLAGRLPFHDARGKPAHVVLARHMHDEPTMLAEAAAGADIPPAIAAVVESALAKDPDDRPPTMHAFAEALQAAAESTTSPPSPLLWRLRGLLLGLILGVAMLWVATPSPQAGETGAHVDTMGPRARTTRSAVVSGTSRLSPDATTPLATIDASPQPASPASPVPATTRTPEHSADRPRPSRRQDPAAPARRALAGRSQAVRQCIDRAMGNDDPVSVEVNIDTAGQISAHVVGAEQSPLSRCIEHALEHTTLAPPPRPLSFVQIYNPRSTPRRP